MFSSVDSMRGGVFIADFRTDVRRASNRLVSQRPLEPALVGVSDFVEREVDRAEAEAAFGGYAADSREGNVASARDLVDRAALAGASSAPDASMPLPPARHISASATASPPSEQS